MADQPRYLAVGRIGRAHGVRGEVGIDPMTDFPERFSVGSVLWLGPERGAEPEPARIEAVRPHKERFLVRFEGVPHREAAQALTGLMAFIPTDEAAELGEDAYYEHQLIGLAVHTDAGQDLGRVTRLMETGAADVLILRDAEGKERLIPMTREVIAEIDLAAGRMTITPLPGLLE